MEDSDDASASLDKEMMDYFENMKIDDEWDELRRKILDIRATSHMTITEFLVCVGLDPNIPYFKQLCSKTTKRLYPSKRRNSPGLEFREAVSKYFANLSANSTSSLSHGSPQQLECQYNLYESKNVTVE